MSNKVEGCDWLSVADGRTCKELREELEKLEFLARCDKATIETQSRMITNLTEMVGILRKNNDR